MITRAQAYEYFAAAAEAIAALTSLPKQFPNCEEVTMIEEALHELASQYHNEFWWRAEEEERRRERTE